MCLLAMLDFGTFESYSKPKSLLAILVAENNGPVCLSVWLAGGRCKTFKSPCHCGNLGIRRLRVSANAFENVLSLLLVNSVSMEKPPEILSESAGSRAFSILEKRAQLYQLIPEASSPFLVLISLLFKK